MLKRFLMTAIMFTLLSVMSLPAAAQGLIIPPPGVDRDASTLSIDYHRVTVDIENQIANTLVEMQFTNHGERLAEGTFIFPLPKGAAIDRLTMIIDGLAIDAKILRADEARAIYDEIVRQYRDPALLEYIGQDLIQANVFPIPPGEKRQIEISYGQVLEQDNGLLHYVYPLHTTGSAVRTVQQMSVSVSVSGNQPISNVYSPSHPIVISRPDDTSFRAGFEAAPFTAQDDFSLYFGIASEEIDLNLLSYKESANEDGYFMLMLQPPLTVDAEKIQPKDVVIVLDQSGSMSGTKWSQAQQAAAYILDNLNESDRFNVIAFSTGYRIFASGNRGAGLIGSGQAAEAKNWVMNSLFAEGGTDIHAALSAAFEQTDNERPLNIIFLTDGLATEGITATADILSSLREKAPDDARIFTFGVGDDVDTFLLDTLATEYSGVGTYVRPSERIDEEVSSLYNKISAPVMNNVGLTITGATTELLYPATIPDLYAGEQVTVVGRYRNNSGSLQVNLTGTVDGERVIFEFGDMALREFAGGEPFIARLWATRRIGALLNQIRLNGESDELVESIINLSLRYGIITPYTSFLIEEDDILSQEGRRAAMDDFAEEAQELANVTTGASAVDAADAANAMNRAQNAAPLPTQVAPPPPAPMGGVGGGGMDMDGVEAEADMTTNMNDEAGEAMKTQNAIVNVRSKTFILQNSIWNDTTFEPDTMTTNRIEFLSDAYFDLLAEHPEAAEYLALGDNVIVVLDGVAYEIFTEE